MKKGKISSEEFKNLDSNKINEAVGAFVDHLNISGGSIGNMDLYRLLRNYVKDEEVRIRINAVLKESES